MCFNLPDCYRVTRHSIGPHVRQFDDASMNPNEAPPVQELPVQSAITNWDAGDRLEVEVDDANETVEVKGYVRTNDRTICVTGSDDYVFQIRLGRRWPTRYSCRCVHRRW